MELNVTPYWSYILEGVEITLYSGVDITLFKSYMGGVISTLQEGLK